MTSQASELKLRRKIAYCFFGGTEKQPAGKTRRKSVDARQGFWLVFAWPLGWDMADETVSTCSLPMPFSQPQQQHPLASLASSVKGVHSALAGRTRIPKAPKPLHKPALAADCTSQGQPAIFLGSSCKRPGLPATVGTSQSGKAATRAAGLIFASVPGASSVLRSAEEQPLLLLSDTVS